MLEIVAVLKIAQLLDRTLPIDEDLHSPNPRAQFAGPVGDFGVTLARLRKNHCHAHSLRGLEPPRLQSEPSGNITPGSGVRCARHPCSGMLCHQMSQRLHKPPSNSASSTPSSTIRGSGSPGLRATRLVPVDCAQIRNSSSEATW